MTIIMSIVIILHGLVHLLYLGQSQRLFELQPGMVWPDDAWAFSALLGGQTTRSLASVACGVVAIGFVVGGVGLLAGQSWWRAVVVAASILSVVVFVLFWDGTTRHLDDQGTFAILINLALLVAVLVLRWPG